MSANIAFASDTCIVQRRKCQKNIGSNFNPNFLNKQWLDHVKQTVIVPPIGRSIPTAVDPSTSSSSYYTGEQLTLASVLAAVLSLVAGFALGFVASRKCAREDYTSCGHHYLETNLSKWVFLLNYFVVKSVIPAGCGLFAEKNFSHFIHDLLSCLGYSV